MAFPNKAASITGHGMGANTAAAAPKPPSGREPMSKKAAIGARETAKKNPFARRGMRGKR